ncbi:MAG: PQQ-dependent sugar dehydrogenase [Verrucomicrobia bacterium]|nr:PQQ-dependent sugar dehydrogenase [Verrucomicrobiota bacterium]
MIIFASRRHFLNRWSALLALWLSLIVAPQLSAAEPTQSSEERRFGIDKRVPWTTSRIIGTPELPLPYRIERVFPKLAFSNAVDFASLPGTRRLLIAELGGKIFSFPNEPTVERTDLFVDLKKEIPVMESLYGVTFHPRFEENRFVYVCYVLKSDLKDGSRVSRFTVSKTDPPRLETTSEKILITWLSGGHNGGSLQFGPDGYLYISTGDGAGPNPPDPLKTGQDNSDLLSAILRLDVDRADEGKEYRVPPDNPFVGVAGTRPEIWAYGFRNPWRMSFDKKSGELWTGDVGWELWELVYRIVKGGNYGWSIVEGPQSIHPDWPRGATPILPPVKAHPHSEAASITGGYVYYGNRLKDLVGAYIYGDWVTGKIWALRNEGNKLASLQELVDTPLQIICFGEDPSGELYIVDYVGGIYRLEKNPPSAAHLNFPRKLSQTGLFESTRSHVPAPGVLPFVVNAEMWSDHALAERFVALPGNSFIQTGATNVWLYQSKNEWRYPTNSVLAKTLYLYLERSGSALPRRVETQILHYDGADWHAYSYRWNNEQTDATLVDATGDEQAFEIKDDRVPGGRRKQTWRFHARSECLRCHNPWVNYALAFTAPQLNRAVRYVANRPISPSLPAEMNPSPASNETVTPANQLRTFSHLRYFDQPLDERARPKLSDPYDTLADFNFRTYITLGPAKAPPPLPGIKSRQAEEVQAALFTNLNERARSWLHVNCAHCHREGAGGSVVSHFDYETKLSAMKAIGRLASQGTFGLVGAQVMTPGDPYSSVLFYRILTTGQGRMPHIGSRFVDEAGAKQIHNWIKQLPLELSENKTRDPADETVRARNAEALEKLGNSANPTGPAAAPLERLLATPNGALALASAMAFQSPSYATEVLDKVTDHPSFQVRDLFERFLPEEKRPKKLGANVKPSEILALKGDAARGRKIFFQEGSSQCQQCHRLDNQGRDFGPDLSHIASKYDRPQILDNILFPSRIIDPNFTTYLLETKDELIYSGFLVRKTEEEAVLKDANAQEIRVTARDLKSLKPQQISAMPELLLQSLTAQDVADLVEFLARLK